MKNKFVDVLKASALVVVATLSLEATGLTQFFFAQKGLRVESSKRAEAELRASNNRIMDVIDQAEAAVRNSVWIAQWCLNVPDSLHRVCQRIVEDNPVVVGSTVAMVPNYLKKKPLFSPYVCRDGDSLRFLSLATNEYDYPSQEWFVMPIDCGDGYWSEPYVDEGGGDMLMTTFSLPITDKKGKIAAVLTADISLDWLKDLIGSMQVYSSAYCVVLSRSGREIVSPPDNAEEIKSKRYSTYESSVPRTGWTMTLVVPHSEVFGALRKIGLVVKLLQILGILLLIILLQSFIRGQLKYKALDQRRERIEGELHIASGIQMSMIPKMFPPFPERHDLDMAATIVPAKEVGGDLYDFYIRDEKLFFCIGDVSGKGVPASLVMAVTRTTFRNLSANDDRPGSIVTKMNNNLSAMNESSMFVTFFCGVLDLTTGALRYCNAGHNPPLTLTNAIKPLDVEPNLPLGIMGGFKFVEQEVKLQHDDAIFLYTDGLTEAENEAHEQFGEERMIKALGGRKISREHLENIKCKVAEFVGNAPQSDDLTVLFIHYLPSAHRLILENDIAQLAQLPAFVEAAVKDSKLDPSVIDSLTLALEETVTNVMLYAYPKDTVGKINIDASASVECLTFVISDEGVPFDPTTRKDVDINASLEDRKIGGLGIHLVRQIMDEVTYERFGNNNILFLVKKY